MNHVSICIITQLEDLDIEFHLIQREYVLIDKYIPIFLLVVRVRQGEDITHTIINHVLTAFIFVGFDRDLYISFSGNSVKLCRD